MEEEMKYKGKGWRNKKFRYKEEPLMLEVTMEAYKKETICNFNIYGTSNEYVDEGYIVPEISLSLEEVTRLRDELNLLIKHEEEYRKFRGNVAVDYVINEDMIPEEQEEKIKQYVTDVHNIEREDQ
jgi:hypothetical protein